MPTVVPTTEVTAANVRNRFIPHHRSSAGKNIHSVNAWNRSDTKLGSSSGPVARVQSFRSPQTLAPLAITHVASRTFTSSVPIMNTSDSPVVTNSRYIAPRVI